MKINILMDEAENHVKEWLSAMSTYPAFDCLKDEVEGIYAINDGNPLND